jgi:hypothetical protein
MRIKKMKTKLYGIAAFAVAALALACSGAGGDTARETSQPQQQPAAQPAASTQATPGASAAHDHHDANVAASSSSSSSPNVPAFMKTAAELKGLAPTLAPEEFAGKARLAYQAVREIPRTVAQLPCYCHCDAGFGHKSLHTCFEDDHASHCAVCVDEALLAYKLQTEDGLKPDQIRELIVAQYSRAQ